MGAKVRTYWVLCLLIFFSSLSLAQNAKIQIISREDKAPIVLAHVKFTCLSGEEKGSLKWTVTDQNGTVINPFSDTTQIDVSYLGFDKLSATLLPYENKVFLLQPGIFGLNELVVTAHFVPIEMQNSIYKITTIKEDRIIEKGANDLREVLNNELNFKTNNGHVNETAINLNGLSGNHVKFMIDGVPVEGRLNGNIDLSQINLDEVERVEIIEGPTSVAYGTNALGGVINVITKKRQMKKLNVSVKSYYETVGKYNFSGKVGFKVKRNLFKLSGGRNFFDGFASKDTSRYKDWKPREQYFGSFLFSRNIHHLKMSYIVDGFSELMTSRGLPRYPYFVNAFDTYYKTQRINNKLLLNGRVGKNKFLDVTLSQYYYQRTRNIYFKDLVTLNETLTSGESDQDTTVFNNYMFRGVFSTNGDSSKIHFMIGTELKKDMISANRVSNYSQEIGDYAIFGNIQYHPVKSITIQPALRYSYNTNYKAPVVPSVNILFNVNDNLNLRTSYAKGFRAPDLKELYLEFHYNSTINLWGNENLASENSDHFNISVDFHKEINNHKISIVPKGYYSKINNLIDLVQTSPVDWTYTNVDYLITKGTSVLVNYGYRNFGLTGAYSYYGNYNSQFDNAEKTNQYFYANDVIAGINYSMDSIGLKINLNYKYTGTIRSYYIDDNANINESFIGDYHTFDLTATKKMWNKKAMLTTGVKNLFNVQQVKMIGEIFGVSNSNEATSLSVLWGRSFFVSLIVNI